MEYIATTSDKLSEADFKQLADLFNDVFNKNITGLYLKKKYTSPVNGYSHVALLKNNNVIQGAFTIIPFIYNYFGKELIFGSVVDLMVEKSLRTNMLIFANLYNKLIETLPENLCFLYAVPNSNSYLYFKRFLRWQDIGRLNYYLMPYSASLLNKNIKWLNPFIKLFVYVSWMLLSLIPWSAKKTPNIRKKYDANFLQYRYSKSDYINIPFNKQNLIFKHFKEDNINTCYIIDVINNNSLNYSKYILKALQKIQTRIDTIMYIGSFPKRIIGFIKVPDKFEPRKLLLIGKKMNENVDNRIYEINNWYFNLGDLDVR